MTGATASEDVLPGVNTAPPGRGAVEVYPVVPAVPDCAGGRSPAGGSTPGGASTVGGVAGGTDGRGGMITGDIDPGCAGTTGTTAEAAFQSVRTSQFVQLKLIAYPFAPVAWP